MSNSKTLVIVESPGKIAKIQSILGNKYIVIASVGHIIDLDKKKLSIDTNTYECSYVTMDNKEKVIDNIKKEAAKCNNKVLIATDKDREGEMIAWSIAYVLKLSLEQKNRIVFTSITKTDIMNALKQPTTINMSIVDAQKTRRILDRLVGYEVSPLLTGSTSNKLSAGRVQSVVTRLIIDKENEISKFVSTNYFKFKGLFNKDINAKLFTTKTNKITKFKDEKTSMTWLKKCVNAIFTVKSINNSESIRNPPPPYTTSSMQQDASRKLNFSIVKTMSTAQKLYEEGYITYMRTDSTDISVDAMKELETYISETFGANYYKSRTYASKNHVQEAHEAIRPTNINTKTTTLTDNENKLYDLIWKRTVASQMSSAIMDICVIHILISIDEDHDFVSKTEVIKFDGYLKLYTNELENMSKQLDITSKLDPTSIVGKESYDKLPLRYNEASLVEKLDPKNLGIGRPSTYASIITKIKDRNYVEVKDIDGIKKNITILELINKKITSKKEMITLGKEAKKFVPTKLGIEINNFLVSNFEDIMDYKFTNNIELKLDDIAANITNKNKVLTDFYEPFHKNVVKLIDANKTNIRVLFDENDFKICALTARYGPVVRKTVNNKHTFAPIKEPYTIDTIPLEVALRLFEYPKTLGKYKRKNVTLKKGEYGLYLTYNKVKTPVQKDVSLDEAIIIINDNTSVNTLKDYKYNYEVYSNRNIKIKPIKNKKLKSFSVIVPENIDLTTLTLSQIKNLVATKYQKVSS